MPKTRDRRDRQNEVVNEGHQTQRKNNKHKRTRYDSIHKLRGPYLDKEGVASYHVLKPNIYVATNCAITLFVELS